MDKNLNDELNKEDCFKNSFCKRCERKYPDTILNIEAYIHHHQPIECIDRKSCERTKRKKRRKVC